MTEERQEEQAALHALGLLTGQEQASFEAEMARTPPLQSMVRELRETTCALVHCAPRRPPPPELRSRVLAAVAARESDSGVIRPSPAVFRTYLPWAAAAVLAGCALWLTQQYLASRTEAELLRGQATLAELALETSRRQLEAERLLSEQQVATLNRQIATQEKEITRLAADLKSQGDLAKLKITALASLLKQSPHAMAVAVWNPQRQEGVLQVEKLPALAAGQDYQLWVVDPQYPNPVDGGVFSVDPQSGEARVAFKARQPVNTVNAFAVTLERKGGVPKAEGPFVLLGK